MTTPLVDALKIKYFLEIRFSQTLILTDVFIDQMYLSLAFDFRTNWYWRKLSKIAIS